MMKILYLPFWGGYVTSSWSLLMSSTPLWLAASISITSMELPEEISVHDSHLQHGSPSTGFAQLSAFAKILALVVLPIPRDPTKRYAWPMRFVRIAFLRVRAI